MSHPGRESEDAEMAVIGALMLSAEAIEDVRPTLPLAAFRIPANKTLCEAVYRVAGRGFSVDIVSVRAELEQMGALADVGGVDYIVHVCESCPSAANAAYYASIVLDAAIRRSVYAKCQKAMRMTTDDKSARELVEDVVQLFASVSDEMSLGVTSVMPMESINILANEAGVSTGCHRIDQATTCRGFPCGQTSIVQAATNVGKTPFLTQVAYDAWRRGQRVCYALFADLTPRQFKGRLAKLVSGFSTPPSGERELFSESDVQHFEETTKELFDPYADDRFIVYDGSVAPARHVEAFKAWVLAENRRRPLDLVCVDYLQTVSCGSGQISPYDRVTAVGHALTAMAAAMPATATVVASQVTVKDSGRTVARYGAEAENDSGLVLEIQKERGATDCAIRIVKNRFGDVGTLEGWVFDKRTLRFIDPVR